MDPALVAVVDTDVVSFVFKNHPLADLYRPILAGRALAISLVSFAEIEYGMEYNSWGSPRRNLMYRFLARFTLLPPDRDTAVIWAKTKNACDRKGRPITMADAWIAAAALQLNVPLITHNTGDYKPVEHLHILTAQASS